MKCPTKNCKGEIREVITYEGLIFNRTKKITNYCPICDFKKVHSFKINEDEYIKVKREL
jgi:hypothetical protein